MKIDIKETQRLLHSAVMLQYTEFLNNIFKRLDSNHNLLVEAVAIDSLIDGEYIIFFPKNLNDFYSKFESLKKVVKEGMNADLVESDLQEALLVEKNISLDNIESGAVKLFFLYFPKNIEDVERFDYSKYKGIVNSVVIGKTIYGDTKIIEDIENKTIIVYGKQHSGIKNFKNILNEEISYKHKKIQIIEDYDLSLGGVPNKKGIYFIKDITGRENEIRDNSANNFIFIELENKGLGYIYDKTSKVKIRTFFKN